MAGNKTCTKGHTQFGCHQDILIVMSYIIRIRMEDDFFLNILQDRNMRFHQRMLGRQKLGSCTVCAANCHNFGLDWYPASGWVFLVSPSTGWSKCWHGAEADLLTKVFNTWITGIIDIILIWASSNWGKGSGS